MTMRATHPHFLLFSTAARPSDGAPNWRFVLQPVGRDACLAVADAEPDAPASRLELLAVVRGLEALEQPSHVTLLTDSRYVIRGIRRGLHQWRERNWQWECFGQLVPVRDNDLWQRIDHAMQFHHVECCEWHEEDLLPGAEAALLSVETNSAARAVAPAAAVDGPALVIVQKPAARRVARPRATNWPLVAAFQRFWRSLWPLPDSFAGPLFTKAA
jgi:ribonuclease HI